MGPGTVQPVVADTTALIAICKTWYAEQVFNSIRMTTTNICIKEVAEGKTDGSNDQLHRNACREFFELQAKGDVRNPDVAFIEPWKRYVDDQGEETITELLSQHSAAVSYVILFDLSAITDLRAYRREHDLSFRIRYPNYLFERLRRKAILTDEEYCEATRQMAENEGWTDQHLLEKLSQVSPVECPALS